MPLASVNFEQVNVGWEGALENSCSGSKKSKHRIILSKITSGNSMQVKDKANVSNRNEKQVHTLILLWETLQVKAFSNGYLNQIIQFESLKQKFIDNVSLSSSNAMSVYSQRKCRTNCQSVFYKKPFLKRFPIPSIHKMIKYIAGNVARFLTCF